MAHLPRRTGYPLSGVQRPYDAFSAVYGALGFSRFATETALRLNRRWTEALPPSAWIADLAGGQGAAGLIFQKFKYRVVTADLSRRMLASAKGIRVQCDIRRLPFRTASFDAAVCLYDAVNHLPGNDLDAFFAESIRVIKPGGRFAFDANTLAGSRMWSGDTYTVKRGGASVEISSRYDSRRRRMENRVSGWVLDRTGKRVAVDETITEWYHPQKKLEDAFSSAGFEIEEVTHVCMDESTPHTPSKWFYELVRA